MQQIYERRSLTPLFLRSETSGPSKRLCSANCELLTLATKDADVEMIKWTRRKEYGEKIRGRTTRKRDSAEGRRTEGISGIVWGMRRYLERKRAAVLIQRVIRIWLIRMKKKRMTQAGARIWHWYQTRQSVVKEKKLAKWLFLLCLSCRIQVLKSSERLVSSCRIIQAVARSAIAREVWNERKEGLNTLAPRSEVTKRKILVEDFKHFVLSSKIEQAVMAFRWNLEVNKRKKQVLEGVKELHRVIAKLLQRCLHPALIELKLNYDECERARSYRPSKQRQSQRFRIRDRKTIQSLSHKLGLALGAMTRKGSGATPGSTFLTRCKRLLSAVLNS